MFKIFKQQKIKIDFRRLKKGLLKFYFIRCVLVHGE